MTDPDDGDGVSTDDPGVPEGTTDGGDTRHGSVARGDSADDADGDSETPPFGPLKWIHWFFTTDHVAAVYSRDIAMSAGTVAVVAVVLFAVSGLWPPMVAVESGSMHPNIQSGDLIFIVDNERFTPEDAPVYEGKSTGVLTAETAHSHDPVTTKFGRPGDVIVYMPNGNSAETPIIHRARLWVEDGENWYDRAHPFRIGNAENCEELDFCPAPYSGFITHGDNNRHYDQVGGQSAPVRPEWIVGTAQVRIPQLGNVRLWFSELSTVPVTIEPAAELQPVSAEPTDAAVEAPKPSPHQASAPARVGPVA